RASRPDVRDALDLSQGARACIVLLRARIRRRRARRRRRRRPRRARCIRRARAQAVARIRDGGRAARRAGQRRRLRGGGRRGDREGAAAARDRLQDPARKGDARADAAGASAVTVAPARAIGAPVDRVEGGEKVAGEALYAYEHEVESAAYAVIVTSTIAKGAIRAIDATAALGVPGVLAVLTHENAGKVEGGGELAILQSPRVAYRGQIVGAMI